MLDHWLVHCSPKMNVFYVDFSFLKCGSSLKTPGLAEVSTSPDNIGNTCKDKILSNLYMSLPEKYRKRKKLILRINPEISSDIHASEVSSTRDNEPPCEDIDTVDKLKHHLSLLRQHVLEEEIFYAVSTKQLFKV